MILTRSVFSSYFVPATVLTAVRGGILKDTESQSQMNHSSICPEIDPTQKQLPEGQGSGDSGQTGTRGR